MMMSWWYKYKDDQTKLIYMWIKLLTKVQATLKPISSSGPARITSSGLRTQAPNRFSRCQDYILSFFWMLNFLRKAFCLELSLNTLSPAQQSTTMALTKTSSSCLQPSWRWSRWPSWPTCPRSLRPGWQRPRHHGARDPCRTGQGASGGVSII